MTNQHDDRQNGSSRRRQRQPLFDHLMDDDEAATPSRPPSPLGDLLEDLDDVLPMRGVPPRRPTRTEPPPHPAAERNTLHEQRVPPAHLGEAATRGAPIRPTAPESPRAHPPLSHVRPGVPSLLGSRRDDDVAPPNNERPSVPRASTTTGGTQRSVTPPPTGNAEPRPVLRKISGAAQPAAQPAAPAVATRTTRPTTRLTTARSEPLLDAEEHPDLEDAQERYRRTEQALLQAHLLQHEPLERPSPFAFPQLSLPTQQRTPMMATLIALASIMIIVTLGPWSNLPIISGWGTGGGSSGSTAASAGGVFSNLFAKPRPAGDYNVQGAPSVTAEQIDRILAGYGSPAAGTGQIWVDLGRRYGIDPAFAVAFFIHESGAGTSPAWAGWKPNGATTHNIGNIICAGYSTCHGRFRDYGSWDEGIEDWYQLIDVEYIQGRGAVTVDQIIPIYAPSFENDVQNYVNTIKRLVDGWRTNGVP